MTSSTTAVDLLGRLEDANRKINAVKDENKRLRAINSELLEALKNLTNEIGHPKYPKHTGMTIVYLDKARATIGKAEESK